MELDNNCQRAHLAAKDGDIKTLESLQSNHNLFGFRDSERQNLLHVAARYGQLDVVSFLLQPPITNQWFTRTVDNQNAFHLAIREQHLQVVKQLFDICPDSRLLHDRNDERQSPLELAIETQFFGAVELMVKKFPELLVIITIIPHENILHLAVRSKCLKTLRFLVDRCPKSYLLLCNSDGQTPLHIAATLKLVDIVKFLVQSCPGAIDMYDCDRMPPFLLASKCMCADSEDTYNHDHTTSFALANKRNSHEILTDLIKQCPRVTYQRDSRGRNVLFFVDDVDTAMMLLDQRPSLISEFDNDNDIPVFKCLTQPNLDLLRCFITRDSNLLLHKNDSNQTLLQMACEGKRLECVNTILTCKPDVVDVDLDGNTPLHMAVIASSTDVIANVFARYPSNLYCKNDKGQTPFHLVIERENHNIITFFLPFVTFDTAIELYQKCIRKCNIDLEVICYRYCDEGLKSLPCDLAQIVHEYTGLTNIKERKRGQCVTQ